MHNELAQQVKHLVDALPSCRNWRLTVVCVCCVVQGVALRCVACQALLLNAQVYRQHLISKVGGTQQHSSDRLPESLYLCSAACACRGVSTNSWVVRFAPFSHSTTAQELAGCTLLSPCMLSLFLLQCGAAAGLQDSLCSNMC